MDTIIIAIGSVTAIGLICPIVLAAASKVMAVAVDERVARLREALPGVNCGACGFSGCDSYAAALIDENAAPYLCTPGGDEVSKQIDLLLGKSPGGGVIKRTAVVHCSGDYDTNRPTTNYEGLRTCAASKTVQGGQGACIYGCAGFGDCAGVCPVDAICIENGLARVDPRKCGGCGLCAKTCPNGIITIEISSIAVTMKCANTEKGARMKDKCKKGCIGCTRCAKGCPSGAITVSDSLARIDNSKCTGCSMCYKTCPRGCLVSLGQ